jgi:hypothetical protein
MSNRAGKDLTEAVPAPGEPQTYDTRSKCKGVPLSTLYHREHGRPSRKTKAEGQQYLTVPEEKALETFLKLMSDFGYPVRIKFLPSFAYSIARQRSTTNIAIKPPSKNWAQAFQKRHPGLKSRRVRALDWKRHESNIYDKIIHWFEVIEQVLKDPAILPENVYNMDETGVMLCMLGSVKVLLSSDDLRDYRGAGVKRTMVTAIECISANSKSLLPMIIWPATTHRSNWTTNPTPGWHYACSESGYTDSKITLEWLKRVFDPQTKGQANKKPRVLIFDGFGTHETIEVLEFCLENNIILCRLPSHTSHKLQPCDVGVFSSLKGIYRDKADTLFRGGANTVGKEHFTSLYSPAREKALTKRNILAGWAACGLFPFNPDRVLRKTPKPLAQLVIPRAVEEGVGSRQQDEFPRTPLTPVSAEGFMSLHNLIKQDAHTLNKRSLPRLQSYVEKLANAGQRSFAECALLKDQNQFLTKMNSEAKVRKSTKPVVLGKGQGKVMSYEDLEEARATRAAKDAAKEARKGKGKRGRKRKSAALEADEPETEAADPEVAREAPGPWRAPVACMYQSAGRGELDRWKEDRIRGRFLEIGSLLTNNFTIVS